MPVEIELKLRFPLDCIVRLQRNPLLKSLSISRSVTQKLYSVYYDTPNFYLKQHGVALRLRRAGKHWLQTIKGGGSAALGLHQRDEWEALVLHAQPDFAKINEPALFKLFSATGLREQLRPIFATEFTRSSRMLRFADGGEAQFCLDRGKITVDNASEPLCEIELELKSGSPQHLFQLALELLHVFPVRQLRKYDKKLENLSVAEVHALRIVAKKQRYIAEFFAGFYPPKEARRYILCLSALQDILGAMNDTANAQRLLSEVVIAENESAQHEAIGIVLGWNASLARLKKLELGQAWMRFYKNRPFW